MRTMRSSGPQPAVGGRCALAASVMSIPMTAKSPLASSQMSGQPRRAMVRTPPACGSAPILRRNVGWSAVFISVCRFGTFTMQLDNIEYIRCQSANKHGSLCGVTDRQMLRQIGENVKAARLRANVTQECLAELVGVHWQTVSHIENGKFPFSVTTFARVSQSLGVSANRLLDGLPAPDIGRMESIKKALARKRLPAKK